MCCTLTPGLVSISFRGHTPLEIIRAIAAAGLETIEWGGDIHVPPGKIATAREVLKATQDHGLNTAAYGSYYYAGWSSAHGLEFPTVLETAVALGAPCVRVWAGREGSDVISPAQRLVVVADLERCATLAAAAGVRIATEFHTDTLMDSATSASMVLEEVSHPALRTNWQTLAGQETGDAIADLRVLAPWLENLHAFHWWPSPDERHPLAEGQGRWRAFLREAEKAPAAAHVLLEFMPRDSLAELPVEAASLLTLLNDRAPYHAARPGAGGKILNR